MDNEVYSVSYSDDVSAWKSFGDLRSLLHDPKFCNVEICVEGRMFNANKEILSLRNEYIGEIIRKKLSKLSPPCTKYANSKRVRKNLKKYDTSRSRTIGLKMITANAFQKILNFFYSGVFEVSANEIVDLWKAANYLRVNHIANTCLNLVKSKKLDQQLVQIFVAARDRKCENAINFIADEMRGDITRFSECPEFMKLSADDLLQLIDTPSSANDKFFLKVAFKWMVARVKGDKDYHRIPHLLDAFNFDSMCTIEIVEICYESEVSNFIEKHSHLFYPLVVPLLQKCKDSFRFQLNLTTASTLSEKKVDQKSAENEITPGGSFENGDNFQLRIASAPESTGRTFTERSTPKSGFKKGLFSDLAENGNQLRLQTTEIQISPHEDNFQTGAIKNTALSELAPGSGENGTTCAPQESPQNEPASALVENGNQSQLKTSSEKKGNGKEKKSQLKMGTGTARELALNELEVGCIENVSHKNELKFEATPESNGNDPIPGSRDNIIKFQATAKSDENQLALGSAGNLSEFQVSSVTTECQQYPGSAENGLKCQDTPKSAGSLQSPGSAENRSKLKATRKLSKNELATRSVLELSFGSLNRVLDSNIIQKSQSESASSSNSQCELN